MGFFDKNKQPPPQQPGYPPQPGYPQQQGVPQQWADYAQQQQQAAPGQWPAMPQQAPGGPQQQQSIADMIAMAKQMQAGAIQQMTDIKEATAGTEVGSMTWARAVMSIIAPAPPGFVKRCNCKNCGAPKKVPSVTAYVYCDFCASLMDYDLRRACDSDTATDPQYPAIVNGLQPSLKAAQAAGDRDAYRGMQHQIYDAYVTYVPNAVSHRARNDPVYRQQLIAYLAEAAVAGAFDPGAQQLEAEMKQRAVGLRYTGAMLSPKVDPDSFWPMTETLTRQIEHRVALNRSAGVTALDPDQAEHMTGKMAWSMFCQGWLPMLPEEAAAQLLERGGLKNEYTAVQVEDGQPRRCGNCGGPVTALPGATAVVCDGCGRMLDVGSAETPCRNCGGTMTLPKGADRTTCPFCKVAVEKVGIL